jgi:hypothetical protein
VENQPAPAPSLTARLLPWLVVFLVLGFVAYVRVRVLAMPLERDEGEDAYAGQLCSQGIPPYQLACNMKLPGTYFAYALGMAVFGQTVAGVHLTLLAANALTIVFVFLLGRRLAGNAAGVAACASYGLMSTSTTVLGLAAHATHFVVLFAVPGTLLLWRAFQTGDKRAAFFSGLLYGLAFLMKQPGLVFGLFGLAVLLWREKSAGVKGEGSRRIILYLAGLSLPFLLLCVYLEWSGVFASFWFWTFSYARQYATATPLAEGAGYLRDFLRDQFSFYIGFWIFAAVGLVAAWRAAKEKTRLVFVLGFLSFSFLGTTPGFYFRQHYFVLMLPAFALLLGLAVESLRAKRSRWLRFAPAMLLAGVIGWDVYLQRWAFFQLPPGQLCRAIYGDNPNPEAQVAGEFIRAHSPPAARVGVVGSEPEIYFYACRPSATQFLYTYPLMEKQPFAEAMQQQMIRELESARPEFMVLVVNRYSWLFKDDSNVEILAWAEQFLKQNYQCTGLVDLRSDAAGLNLWGEAAANLARKPEQYLAVYQRKP